MSGFEFTEKSMLSMSPGEASEGMDFFHHLWLTQHNQNNRLVKLTNSVATSITECYIGAPRDIDTSFSRGDNFFYLSYCCSAALQDAVTAVYHLAGDIGLAGKGMRIAFDYSDPFAFPDVLEQFHLKGCMHLPWASEDITSKASYSNPFFLIRECQEFAHRTQFWILCTTQVLRLWAVHEQIEGCSSYMV
jgi:hypothetical protein